MTLYIGIDPGEKTGVALLDDSNGHVEYEEVPGGYDGFIVWALDTGWWDLLDAPDTVIVFEKFTLRNNDFVANTTPLEIMGAMKLLIRQYGWDVIWCTPAQHKTLITDAAIKRAGLYPPRGQVKGGHVVDGMRLICWYKVAKLRDREFSEKLFPKPKEEK